MKFLASLGIGMPVTFLGLIIFTGGVEDAWMVLVVSVICTAGIGLVVWIPVFWGVGAATLALIGIFVKKKPDGKDEAKGSPPDEAKGTRLDLDQTAMTEYMKKAHARGMSHDEISDRLHQQGWSFDVIKSAFRTLSMLP
ncbi:MAG: hypothetical protein IH899_01290 [Planctomycetes bacterium]|nr:hypothetical protein [Planctomycetota bacterium]